MGRHGVDSNAEGEFGFSGHRDGDRGHGTAWMLGALVLVALLVAGVILWRTIGTGSGTDCDSREAVSVIAAPTMAATIKPLAATASGDSCYDFNVTAVTGANVAGQLTKGENAPDLWIADSTTRARTVTDQTRVGNDVVAASVAVSPVVVAGKDVPPLENWVDVMKLPGLRLGNPIDSSTGDAPIVGALAAQQAGAIDQKSFTDAMTLLALQQGNARMPQDSDNHRLGLAATSDSATVVSEQNFIDYQRASPDSGLSASVPSDGTVVLDFPMLNTASAARKEIVDEAGKELLDVVTSSTGAEALTAAGFRTSMDEPAPPGGVGDVTVLTLSDPDREAKALRQWAVLGVPIRTLVVEDVSGSMSSAAGASTRAEMLVDASMNGLKLFPNSTALGAWLFSIDLGGKGQDWMPLAQIEPLDAEGADGETHREYLESQILTLPDRVGGATGLYDTTLAAFKEVQNTYDPNYSNSVIILTDGQNEDPNSISLDELLAELKRLEDPARPVLVLTIGITEDADAVSLKKIADATGGTSYIAETPADISSVFVDAVAARIEAAGR
ncbi:substrate-binding domain-containing protein [Nocardia sp. 348MFTsu5.1]|uniref:substrate-binding domain-containing protein n=1 Tax=Nocardia sp. 348MFTsu5.1 TaxID=1172185 RepID=UPI0003784977|nr:substrate-binding domain-containing protein [Nocardia sp. 348MFTsu5.1]